MLGFAANLLAGKSWIQKLGDLILASNRLLIKANGSSHPVVEMDSARAVSLMAWKMLIPQMTNCVLKHIYR